MDDKKVQNNITSKMKTCFVVTPIGAPGSDIRRHIDGVIKSAIEPVFDYKYNDKNEYDVQAAHTYFDSTSITKQVYQKLYDSELVIVNLTGKNPNVMYELGIRFCFGKPTILIAEEGTELPFDINERRTIFYTNDAFGMYDLIESLKKIKNSIKLDDIDSPVHDAIKQKQLFTEIEQKSGDDRTVEMLSAIMERLDDLTTVTKSKSIKSFTNDIERDDFVRHSEKFYRLIRMCNSLKERIPELNTNLNKNEFIILQSKLNRLQSLYDSCCSELSENENDLISYRIGELQTMLKEM